MTVAHLIAKKPYEDRIIALRRHWLTMAKRIAVYVVLAAIPFGGYLFLRDQFPEILASTVGYPALVLGTAAYELGMWLFLFTMFLDYELDMWVVTNDRLVNIEQHGLFARTIAELDLWRVQDVTSDVRGVFPTFFNYGTVYVQTAGAKERFALEQVPQPHEVRKIILDMADIDRKFHERDIAEIQKIATTA